jgi:hypothetical protein
MQLLDKKSVDKVHFIFQWARETIYIEQFIENEHGCLFHVKCSLIYMGQ